MSDNNKPPKPGLVQRKIRTKLGNVVTRWVKPDNPNIVNEAAPAAPARQARRRAAGAPRAAEIVPALVEPAKVEYDWTYVGYPGCCGGRILIATPKKGDTKTDEELTKEWEATYYGRAYYEASKRSLKSAEVALEHLVKTGRNLPEYRYFRRAELERSVRSYKASVNRYSLEEVLRTRKIYGNDWLSFVDPKKPLLGVTLSKIEFPGSTKTPGGLFVRADKEPGTSNSFRAIGKRVAEVDLVKHLNPRLGSAHNFSDSRGRTLAESEPSFVCMWGMGTGYSTVASLWASIKARHRYLTAGTVITFIANHNQNNAYFDKIFNEAGFECVLITGNSNHGNSSVLYLYEHVLTQSELDALA